MIASNEKGFTLVEIIAVLVILGILAAVAVPKYFDMQETAEIRSLNEAYAGMAGRNKSKYHASILNNTVGDPTDYDTFGDLELDNAATPLSDVFRDFQGVWAGGGANAITYTAKNGGTVYTFTLGSTIAASSDAPASIDVSPALP